MKKQFFLTILMLVFLGFVSAKAAEATTYTSNVDISNPQGSNANAVKVEINGTAYDAIKVGTGSAGGNCKIKVPANTTTLTLHAAAWKGVTGLSLNITGATVSPASIALSANSGVTSNSPFTVTPDNTKEFFTISLTGVTAETELTFTTSTTKRFVIWGINSDAPSGGGEDPGTGEDPEPEDNGDFVTLDFSKEAWGFPSDYTKDEASYSDGTYSITCSYGTAGDGWKKSGSALLIGKTNAYITLPAFDFAVSKIVCEAVSGSSNNVIYNIFDGETAVSTQCTGTTSEHEFAIAEDYQVAGKQFIIKILSNHNAQFSKIKIYKKAGSSSEPEIVAVTGVTLSESTLMLTVGDTKTLTATVTPDNATNKAVTWSSNNTNVATVADGVVTAVAAGNAVITVTTVDGGFTATCAVHVNAPVVVTPYTVTFNAGTGSCATTSLTETTGGQGVTLPAATIALPGWTFAGWATAAVTATTTAPELLAAGTTFKPTANCTLFAVYAKASSSSAQWVKQTAVPADTEGEYVIVAAGDTHYVMKAEISDRNRFNNGDNATLSDDKLLMTSTPAADEIWTIYKKDGYYRIKNGSDYAGGTGSKNQGALLTDEDDDLAKWIITYDDGFVFENYGRSIAETDSSNKILRNNGDSGWATYVASTGNAPVLYKKIGSTTYNSNPEAEATVAVTGVTLSESTLTLTVGEHKTLTATVAPENATDKAVTWSSSDEAIATVANGKVTAIAAGDAVITVTTVDGSFTATCDVTVNPITYTVTYNANGGKGTVTDNIAYIAGSEATAAAGTGLSREGYTFAGWNTKADGSGTAIAAGDTFTVNGDMTLFAQWTKPASTVTFDACAGSCDETSLTEAVGGQGITLPAATTSVAGWSFAGWATAAVTETTTAPALLRAGATFIPAADCTLYAVYKKVDASGNGFYLSVDYNGTTYYVGTNPSGKKYLDATTSAAEAAVWAVDEGYLYYTVGTDVNYVSNTANTTDLTFNSDKSDAWAWIVEDTGDIITFKWTDDTNSRYLGFNYNNNSPRFAAYADNAQYPHELDKTPVGTITYNSNPEAVAVDPVAAFDLPIHYVHSGKECDVPEHYADSDGAVTHVASEHVTIRGTTISAVDVEAGKTTIVTATIAETDTHASATAQYMVKVAPQTVDVKKDVRYVPFSHEYHMDFSENDELGAIAFVVTEFNGTYATYARIADQKVPANTGVILRTVADKNIAEVPVLTEPTVLNEVNLLRPVLAGESVPYSDDEYVRYVLDGKDFVKHVAPASAPGMARAAAAPVTVNSAYLELPNDPEKSYPDSFKVSGELTGIEDVTIDTESDGNAYNILGQRVNDNYRGIVVRKGQKTLNK